MRYSFFALPLFFSPLSLAGAWGVGSFENDSAMDWVYELELSTSSSFLGETFDHVEGRNYLEVDECSAAIAAAEVVASIIEKSLSHLPDAVQEWAGKYDEIDNNLKLEAVAAVMRCADIQTSELAQLWGESSSNEWSSYMSTLQSRLQ